VARNPVDKAIKNHIMWHDREPDKVSRRSCTALNATKFHAVAKAVNIIYDSDKWNEKGKEKHLYDHDFDSRPTVYEPCSCAAGTCRSVSRDKLLGSGHQKGTCVLTELGTAVELTLDDGETSGTQPFAKKTYLYSTPDLKALVIPYGSKVYVIRGGQMRVTERGIVK